MPWLSIFNLIAGSWLLVVLIKNWDNEYVPDWLRVFDIVLIAVNYGIFFYRFVEWMS